VLLSKTNHFKGTIQKMTNVTEKRYLEMMKNVNKICQY